MINKIKGIINGIYDNGLNRWASIVTIISFPTIIIGLVLGYIQINDRLTKPEVELSFVNSSSVAYKVLNTSKKTAEDVLVSFGIFDLTNNEFLPIPTQTLSYVNQYSAKGPFSLFGKYGIKNHTYFGILYVGCKGGKDLNTYWLYVKHGIVGKSFYSRRNKNDTYNINPSKIITDKDYLNSIVSQERRIYIKD